MRGSPVERRALIWETVLSIPEGRVASYGQVAELAGMPGRARLVGRAMRDLPSGSYVPWFRVLRSDGRVAFPEGSEHRTLQTELLEGEGVEVRNGRVDRTRFGWSPDA